MRHPTLETLERGTATPTEYAAASAPGSERRTVVVDEPDRVVVVEWEPDAGAPVIRRTATLTWFLADRALQLRLASRDLFVFADIGAAVRELAATLEWEEVA